MDKDGDGDVLSARRSPSVVWCASLHYAARLVGGSETCSSLADAWPLLLTAILAWQNSDAQVHTVTALKLPNGSAWSPYPHCHYCYWSGSISQVQFSLCGHGQGLSWLLRKNGNLLIPRHLRDGHYAGSKELGTEGLSLPSLLSWQLGHRITYLTR